MSISKVQAILAGNLSDTRMQAWATTALPSGESLTFSRWKITINSDSGWTDWQQQSEDYNSNQLLGTCLYATLQSILFLDPGTGSPEYRAKATQDANSGWTSSTSLGWPPPGGGEFPPIFGTFAVSALGGYYAPYSANAPIQLWVATNDDSGLFTSENSGIAEPGRPNTFWDGWSVFPAIPPEHIQFIMPLNYGPSDVAISTPATVPVWACGNSGILYWLQASMLYDADGNLSEGPTWSDFQEFTQLPGGAAVTNFATGVLPDGRVQLFASDSNGTLFSIWQNDIISGSWIPEWTPFPQPGALPVLVNNENNILWPNISTQPMSLAMAQLPDRRLQLFAIDQTAAVWSTWKSTDDPDAGWEPWSEF